MMPQAKRKTLKKAANAERKNWRAYVTKRNILIALCAAFVIVVVAGLLFITHHNDQKSQQNISDTLIGSSASSKPGTYLTILTEPGGIDGISGLENCKSQKTLDEGTSCQLDDTNPTITLTAKATVTKDGKKYVFTSWTGCKSQGNSSAQCVVTVTKGAAVSVKANYKADTASKTGSTSDTSPSITVNFNFGAYGQSYDSRVGPTAGPLGVYTPTGSKTITVGLETLTHNVSVSSCTIIDHVTVDDLIFSKQDVTFPSVANQNVTLTDGMNSIAFNCTSGKNTATLTVNLLIEDNLPKQCANFSFSDSSPTVSTLADLQSGIVGTWAGCVSTPWMPAYYVTVTFNGNGTYSASGNEVLDGRAGMPMYYGGQQNSPHDTYELTDMQANGTGKGTFNLFFNDGSGSVVNEDLRDVKLMGNKLSFNFKHFNQYGPLSYQLYRQ